MSPNTTSPEESATTPPKLFHTGKVLRERSSSRHHSETLSSKWPYPPSKSSRCSTSANTDANTHEDHSSSSLQELEHNSESNHSEEGYWSMRTRKLISQHQSMSKTNTEIYGRVAMKQQHMELSNSSSRKPSITITPSTTSCASHEESKSPPVQINAQLFKGLVFFFNSIRGEGIHSQFHLTKLASIHGATVLPNPSRKRKLTHVIASNLPNSKVERMEKKKHITNTHVKYVNPQWIKDCISQNRVLPEAKYLLTNNENGQKKIM
ncbi:hypothetical protein C9374_010153 [Naegleria lovaniensis]|uniref:BRCT domain-containing protein n=1 Tax=Naegleria lovaniensis TaxID=51637 RepID=A0AA88GIE9_NAELO|nr:uncharacterized protein C9374_010153 [Naegleria lovaniensis]KAG2375149.1 hypothetical protein C9374_010153 [Naegleria lovaniensis]